MAFFAVRGVLAEAARHALAVGAPDHAEADGGVRLVEKAGQRKSLMSARTAARWRSLLEASDDGKIAGDSQDKSASADIVMCADGSCAAVPLGEVMQLAKLLAQANPPFDFRDADDVPAAASPPALSGESEEDVEKDVIVVGPEARTVRRRAGPGSKPTKGSVALASSGRDEAAAVRALLALCDPVDPRDPASDAADTSEHARHTKKLQLEADARAYGRMVQNVDAARIDTTGGLSTMGRELKNMNHMMAMGFNLLFTCGSVFLATHFLMKQAGYPEDSAAPILSGLAAAIVLLIVETVLYMIRSEVMEERVPMNPDENRRSRGHQLSVLNAEPGGSSEVDETAAESKKSR